MRTLALIGITFIAGALSRLVAPDADFLERVGLTILYTLGMWAPFTYLVETIERRGDR